MSAEMEFSKMGHLGTFWDIGIWDLRLVWDLELGAWKGMTKTQASNHKRAPMTQRPMNQTMTAFVRACCALLCKTGGVMRFCDHGGAAVVYKSGKCRGICVKIVLDFSLGAVGFLINGAQRVPTHWRMFPHPLSRPNRSHVR